MSVRVRLTRVGSKKNPIWRVVVTDQRSPRDGRFIETIGHYNPQTEPSTIVLDNERLQHWLARGAQPTGTVKQLVKAQAKGLQADPRTSVASAAAAPATAPTEITGDSTPAPEVEEPVEAADTPEEPAAEEAEVQEPVAEESAAEESAADAAPQDDENASA